MKLQNKTNKNILALAKLQVDLSKLPQLDLKVNHIFAPGIYIRELSIPKNVVVIGKTHKTEHLNTILQGRCKVTINGSIKYLTAPCTFISKKGSKKVIEALEDTLWSTIHPTNETDLDKLENLLIDSKMDNELIKLGA